MVIQRLLDSGSSGDIVGQEASVFHNDILHLGGVVRIGQVQDHVHTMDLKSLEDVLHELVEVSTFGESMRQPGTPGFKTSSILGKSVLEWGLSCLAAELARLDQSALGLPPVQTVHLWSSTWMRSPVVGFIGQTVNGI